VGYKPVMNAYTTLTILIRMEIKWLHDGNLKGKKSRNLSLLSMFEEK
jgi:hypothetical protein